MKFDIFSELDAARIEEIKAASKYVELPKGSILFYEGDACESVLYLTEDEINILVGARDYAKAAKLYDKACELKSPIGCAFFGAFYRDGRGVAQSYEKAAEIFTKACEIDSGNGCYDLAELHEGGLGVGQDIKTAMKYLDKACELGDPKACDRRP